MKKLATLTSLNCMSACCFSDCNVAQQPQSCISVWGLYDPAITHRKGDIRPETWKVHHISRLICADAAASQPRPQASEEIFGVLNNCLQPSIRCPECNGPVSLAMLLFNLACACGLRRWSPMPAGCYTSTGLAPSPLKTAKRHLGLADICLQPPARAPACALAGPVSLKCTWCLLPTPVLADFSVVAVSCCGVDTSVRHLGRPASARQPPARRRGCARGRPPPCPQTGSASLQSPPPCPSPTAAPPATTHTDERARMHEECLLYMYLRACPGATAQG